MRTYKHLATGTCSWFHDNIAIFYTWQLRPYCSSIESSKIDTLCFWYVVDGTPPITSTHVWLCSAFNLCYKIDFTERVTLVNLTVNLEDDVPFVICCVQNAWVTKLQVKLLPLAPRHQCSYSHPLFPASLPDQAPPSSKQKVIELEVPSLPRGYGSRTLQASRRRCTRSAQTFSLAHIVPLYVHVCPKNLPRIVVRLTLVPNWHQQHDR